MKRKFVECDNCGKKIYENDKCYNKTYCSIYCSSDCMLKDQFGIESEKLNNDLMENCGREFSEEDEK